MISPENGLSGRLEHMADLEQARLQTLTALGLLETESVPVFEEATQTAAHFLETSICVLGMLDRHRLWYKSAVGLSRLGLMNSLASTRRIDRNESLCAHVVETQQVLVIADASTHPIFATTALVQHYGVQAYLGVPMVTSDGICIGALAVMELEPRSFTRKDIDFLQLMARWSMSEFERDRLIKRSPQPSLPAGTAPISIKASLMSQMTQELCTPLTSILGMGSVLSQGIYGTLTDKQQKYIEIIHNSGQYLLSLVNEIVDLGALDDSDHALKLMPVDIEMLCQQAIATLAQSAQRREQQIKLTIEPGQRIWLLDKGKVRQLIYHLVFGIIQTSNAGGTIRIHVSRKRSDLSLSIWISHPWLGDGLPTDYSLQSMSRFALVGTDSDLDQFSSAPSATWNVDDLPEEYLTYSESYKSAEESKQPDVSRQGLGLQLSSHLAELHGGNLTIKGSSEEGYRYVVRLPYLQNREAI